jgi:hypothetical protein
MIIEKVRCKGQPNEGTRAPTIHVGCVAPSGSRTVSRENQRSEDPDDATLFGALGFSESSGEVGADSSP